MARHLMADIRSAITHILPDYKAELSATTPLGEGGLELDSIQILELLLKLESDFDIELVNEDVTSADLATVASLENFVSRRLNK